MTRQTLETLLQWPIADSLARLATLTPRELETANAIYANDGRNFIDVAAALGITRKTLDIHRTNVFAKLGGGVACVVKTVAAWRLAEACGEALPVMGRRQKRKAVRA